MNGENVMKTENIISVRFNGFSTIMMTMMWRWYSDNDDDDDDDILHNSASDF